MAAPDINQRIKMKSNQENANNLVMNTKGKEKEKRKKIISFLTLKSVLSKIDIATSDLF